ncbi:zinc-ribbon and DUF3426 domain-containing protein [Polaromonas sp. CG_9.5]|uniref:zinc-ribbon and DUF3426 domain-containing protein n=1 Tax=Polaromonas sp. CG_9.5 TaxID=3071705 RepID=UPI002E0F1ACD
MNLVTRCPACETMFKVTPDQLKIADDWVRCGRCSEVFEASLVPAHAAPPAALIPEADTPPALDQPAAMPAPQPPETPSFSAFSQHGLADNALDFPDNAPSLKPDFAQSLQEAPTPQDEAAPQAPAPADEAAPQAEPQEAMKIQPDVLPASLAASMAALQEPERIEPTFFDADLVFKPASPPLVEPLGFSANAPPLAAEPPESAEELSFMREAQHTPFWTPARLRTALVLLFTLLLLALALQWTVRQKDVLAAQQSWLAPWLQALCRPLGCEVRPLRRIESVKVESAKFSKSGSRAYRLTFVLKNTGAAAVEIPALEVTLTDKQHQALVRRVLLPAQFGVTATTLQAHSELAGLVALTLATEGDRAAALPVTGYRILAFYP